MVGPAAIVRWATKIYSFWETDLIRKSHYDLKILFTQDAYGEKNIPQMENSPSGNVCWLCLIDMTSKVLSRSLQITAVYS